MSEERALIVAGNTAYHRAQVDAVTAAGVPTEIYRGWGAHLPDHVDAILKRGHRIILLQWPESVCWREAESTDLLADMARALERLRSEGRVLLWTMHNLLPHAGDPDGFWSELYQIFANRVDGTIHHSEWGKGEALRRYRFRSGRHAIIGHGYDPEVAEADVEDAGAVLPLRIPSGCQIFSTIGAVREDKRTRELVEFWRGRPRHQRLVVGGSCKGEYGREVIDLAQTIPHVEVLGRGLSPAELLALGRRSDAFLYIHGQFHLTSGGPHLAQACLCPPILPDTPYNREVLGDAAWYLSPVGGLFEDLNRVLDGWQDGGAEEKRGSLRAGRPRWSWKSLGRLHAAFYRAVLEDVKSDE